MRNQVAIEHVRLALLESGRGGAEHIERSKISLPIGCIAIVFSAPAFANRRDPGETDERIAGITEALSTPVPNVIFVKILSLSY